MVWCIVIIYKQSGSEKGIKGNIRSSHQMCSLKTRVLKNFTKFTGNYLYNKIRRKLPVPVIKLQPKGCKILAQVFSCEFCEVF